MLLKINDRDYILKYNLLSRIKLSNLFDNEQKMFELIQKKDFISLIHFIKNCIQGNITESEFLKCYPKLKETKEAFFQLALKIIETALNPLDMPLPIKNTENEKEPQKINYKELILNIMSKGYTQEQVLDMTSWDISLILEADYKKLERETLHTNALINTIIGIMGGKEKFDLLGREKKIENLEQKYKIEISALDLLNKSKNSI